MLATLIFVGGFITTNDLRPLRYSTGNRRDFGPLQKPVTERSIAPESNLTGFGDTLIRRRLVPGDQKRELTEKRAFIAEALHNFGCRRTNTSIPRLPVT